MTAENFWEDIKGSEWRSKGDSTLRNSEFNDYSAGDWRKQLILDNEQYYPPGNVRIKVKAQEITRGKYTVPHHAKPVTVPETIIKTFTLEVSGDEFAGKELLASARFIVMGDHAVSSPITISSTKSVVIVVRLNTPTGGKQVMVNELIWSVQYESSQAGSQTFYDIQKWYCCRYP